MTPNQILFGVFIVLLLTTTVLLIIYLKKRAAKKLLDKEDKAGLQGKKYQLLYQFMLDLPEYSIKDDLVNRMYRKTLESVGGEFQQRVFIDTTGGPDKTVWLRKKGNMFIHDKGFYFDPIYYTKSIVYHFKDDARPIVDMANSPGWQNPDMCSRYVYSAVNTADMNARKGVDEKMLMMILAAIGIIAIVGAFLAYQGMRQEETHYATLYNLINQTRGY